jgi:predicted dienelactone hydrolase
MKAWSFAAPLMAALLSATMLFEDRAAAAEPVAVSPTISAAGVDAPELAHPGPHRVGVRSLTLVEPGVPDMLAYDKAKNTAPIRDRTLVIDVWYPAKPASADAPVVYRGSMPSQEPGQAVAFAFTGVAVRDAAPDRGEPYPLVILSHGQNGTPVAMSWLAENLASKGYVVAGIHHEDPPNFFGGLSSQLYRPLDIVFTAHALQVRARAGDGFLSGLVDPARVALAGYSMGGYGVVTAGGAQLSPQAAAAFEGGYLTPYARGGAKAQDLRIEGLKAIVAIAPAGGGARRAAWDAEGLKALHAPTLFIVGDQDQVVGFDGVKSLFEGAVNAPRYMLVYKEGAHSIGMNGAPETMRHKLWDLDWFEDPVWRKDRVIGVNLHMITAFLDLYVKGDKAKAGYLDLIPNSDDWAWAAPRYSLPYDIYSPGTDGVTVWKGFQRVHTAGLQFFHRDPAGQ